MPFPSLITDRRSRLSLNEPTSFPNGFQPRFFVIIWGRARARSVPEGRGQKAPPCMTHMAQSAVVSSTSSPSASPKSRDTLGLGSQGLAGSRSGHREPLFTRAGHQGAGPASSARHIKERVCPGKS